jgi:hypothetical protein
MMPLLAFADEIAISHLMSQMAMSPGDIPKYKASSTPLQEPGHSSHPAAYTSALSVAKALFGRMNQQQQMIDQAAQLYGQALRYLRDAIEGLHAARYPAQPLESLWSSLFLGMYEMISISSSADWLHHSLGVAALTRLAEPQAFQEEAALRLLESNRSLIALGAIVQRKRTFLEQSIWQTVPWALQPGVRSTTQLLHDLLCEIPGLFEDADIVHADSSNGNRNDAFIDVLNNKVIAVYRRLVCLKQQWHSETQGACWEAAPESSSVSFDTYGNPLFDSVLFFTDVEFAMQYIQFNVLSLLLRSISRTAGLALPPSITIANPLACGRQNMQPLIHTETDGQEIEAYGQSVPLNAHEVSTGDILMTSSHLWLMNRLCGLCSQLQLKQ